MIISNAEILKSFRSFIKSHPLWLTIYVSQFYNYKVKDNIIIVNDRDEDLVKYVVIIIIIIIIII